MSRPGWEGGIGWERTASGGGSSGTPDRVAPDSHAVLVYYDQSGLSAGTVPNAGSAGALALTAAGALVNFPGEFGEAAAGCAVQNGSGTAGGTLKSAGTTYGEGTAITLDAWIWMLSNTSYPGFTPVFGKTYDPTTFAPTAVGPVSATLFFLQDGTAGGYVALTNGDTPGLVTPVIAPGTRHHLGITHDGTTLKLYFDGALSDSVSAPHAVDWGNHGRIILGGFTNNGGVYGSPPAIVGDCRWSDIARDASYFAQIWATRRTP